jgi:hypothetical protein
MVAVSDVWCVGCWLPNCHDGSLVVLAGQRSRSSSTGTRYVNDFNATLDTTNDTITIHIWNSRKFNKFKSSAKLSSTTQLVRSSPDPLATPELSLESENRG